MSMTEIVLDPVLGISAEQFAAQWNESACREIGSAELVVAQPKSFDIDPVTILIIGGVLGVGFDSLKEAIKIALNQLAEKKKAAGETLFVPAHAELVRHKRPDGSELIVITVPAPKQ